MNSINLVDDIKSGDNSRLKIIFEDNYSYCIKRLASRYKCAIEDAEDIYIDAIINFRDKIVTGKIEVLTDIRSYLFTTCRNMLLVKMKTEARIGKAVLNIYDAHDHDETGHGNSYVEELSILMESALNTIPDKCQNLLKAFYFDKLSLEAIAQRFKMKNENVAKVSKARCFKKLVEQVRLIKDKLKACDVVE